MELSIVARPHVAPAHRLEAQQCNAAPSTVPSSCARALRRPFAPIIPLVLIRVQLATLLDVHFAIVPTLELLSPAQLASFSLLAVYYSLLAPLLTAALTLAARVLSSAASCRPLCCQRQFAPFASSSHRTCVERGVSRAFPAALSSLRARRWRLLIHAASWYANHYLRALTSVRRMRPGLGSASAVHKAR